MRSARCCGRAWPAACCGRSPNSIARTNTRCTRAWPRSIGKRTSGPGHTLAVDAHVSGEALTHARYAAQRVKDGVVDVLRKNTGARPDVDIESPDVRLNLVVRKNRAILSIDLGGGPLHRRGWRRAQGEAPLKENLAAAVLMRGQWPALYRDGACAARSDVRQRHAADRRRADGGRCRAGPAAPRRGACRRAGVASMPLPGNRWSKTRSVAATPASLALRPAFFGSDVDATHPATPRAATREAAGVGHALDLRPTPIETLTRRQRRRRRAASSSATRRTTRASPPIPRCIAHSAMRCAAPCRNGARACCAATTNSRAPPACARTSATSCSTARSNAR